MSTDRSLFSAGCFTPASGPSLWLVRWGWWWVERKRTFVARAFAVGSIWEIDDWCGSGAENDLAGPKLSIDVAQLELMSSAPHTMCSGPRCQKIGSIFVVS